ncbi:MAG TPA: hypothetical protein VF648_21335 [Pyrinomonadaceae bacterium]|jgi:hypothetical protein
MANDFLQNLGELGASIKQFIREEVKRGIAEERKMLASGDFDDEPYDLSPSQLSAYMQKAIGRDKIMEFVHLGVLRGCFIQVGTHYRFKAKASKRAIELHSEREIYGDELPASGGSVHQMPNRRTT